MMLIDFTDLILLVTTSILAVLWWRSCHKASKATDGLPPGPPGWPLVGNLVQVILQRRHIMYVVRDLRLKYGPIFTLKMGARTMVFISSSDLIHEALVKRGPVFANRPPDSPIRLVFSCGKCSVNSAHYGPLWRTLRRNFVAELVTPTRVKQFSWIREWAISNHFERLRAEFRKTGSVEFLANCRLTICSILCCICFGAKVPESHVREIEQVMKEVMLISTPKLPDFLPALSPLFRKEFNEAKKLRKRQLDCMLPLVRARRAFVKNGGKIDHTSEGEPEFEMVSGVGEAYIDSLFDMEVEEKKGGLGEDELVTLCSEVMSAGTDTSATALEWAMLHLVLDPVVQDRVYKEVVAKVGMDKSRKITEADVEGMTYLQAVVKETLRRHPPSHFVLSHAATHDTELAGYRIPANANVEFYTAWVTQDPSIWTDPDKWQPERFLEGGEGYDADITGTRGVRMMPFGVGRRICPAATLGMLHVHLMMARMVREFKWIVVPGEQPPDPTETFAFTVVLKEPLRAAIVERDDNHE
ncbi:hypothetical protein LUZ63_003719 [Rhynchospora breviuscula]|uniref:Cytochrome P450 77A3 n=1 Tax=Rhynchospora breviuscula TaxID=2022672 RepID=A0A9Q0D1W2_9POAL|nr:hypothetical protein LUZ63_003719 [Rhynchospora breviuscula]